MKRLIKLLIIPVLVLALAACGGDTATTDGDEIADDDTQAADADFDNDANNVDTEDGTTDDEEIFIPDAQSSNVLGSLFYLPDAGDIDGVETVQIEDILFNTSGAIEYIVIDTGGLFDDTNKMVAVGVDVVEYIDVDGDRVISYTQTYTELDTFPEFDLTAIGDGVAINDENPAMAEFAGLFRASKYEDFALFNEEGERLGDVSDLLIDFNLGEVTYAVVDVGGFLEMGETERAIPWDAMVYDIGAQTFILPVSRETIENAPEIDLTLWVDGPAELDWDANIREFWEGITTG